MRLTALNETHYGGMNTYSSCWRFAKYFPAQDVRSSAPRGHTFTDGWRRRRRLNSVTSISAADGKLPRPHNGPSSSSLPTLELDTSTRIPEKKGLDRQTDGQQSDPIRVPFFPFELRNPYWYIEIHSVSGLGNENCRVGVDRGARVCKRPLISYVRNYAECAPPSTARAALSPLTRSVAASSLWSSPTMAPLPNVRRLYRHCRYLFDYMDGKTFGSSTYNDPIGKLLDKCETRAVVEFESIPDDLANKSPGKCHMPVGWSINRS
ncbi:hypothetical protein EVAR_8624_1 [Eumeta japonica]|uniref:Uncharacterized protein n=1 Tax=Eumeta variegata TaxID=151549 RepID=A0A4C1TUC4_EUMVA|nr:hypothetical protein EVAR_8624_1 [Eumeta japonica]